jgi:cytochrome c
MFKPFLLLSAAILFAIALTTGPTLAAGRAPQQAAPAPAAPASTNPVKPTPASQERAKKLYAQDCALCHGDNGNGKTDIARDMQLTVPDWTDAKTLAAKPDHELFDAIRNGKEKMPPEAEGRAKNDDVWNLIIYLRAFSKGQPAEAPKPTN